MVASGHRIFTKIYPHDGFACDLGDVAKHQIDVTRHQCDGLFGIARLDFGQDLPVFDRGHGLAIIAFQRNNAQEADTRIDVAQESQSLGVSGALRNGFVKLLVTPDNLARSQFRAYLQKTLPLRFKCRNVVVGQN